MAHKETAVTQKSGKSMIRSLQAGRGLAALAVLFFHAYGVAGGLNSSIPGGAVLKLGYLGVDFFFVLSGFIIYYSTVAAGGTIGSYMERRVTRVYLPYLPIGLGVALLQVLLPQYFGKGDDWAWLPTLTLAPVSAGTALDVAWTLKHEMLFYVIFGVGFFSGRLWTTLGIWLVAIVAANLVSWQQNVMLSLINIEFFMGIAVARLAERGFGNRWLYPLGVMTFGLWILTGTLKEASPIAGLAFAMIIVPLIQHERTGHVRVPNWLYGLGTVSYSLYLVHGPFSALAMKAFQDEWGRFLGSIVVSIVAAIAYYYIIERNSTKVRISRWFRKAAPAG